MFFRKLKLKKILSVDSLDDFTAEEIIKMMINKNISENIITDYFPDYSINEIKNIKNGFILEILDNGERLWLHSSYGEYKRKVLVNAYNKGFNQSVINSLLELCNHNYQVFDLIITIITNENNSLSKEQLKILLECSSFEGAYSLITQIYRAFKLNMTAEEVKKIMPPKIKETAYNIREDIIMNKFYSIIIDAYLTNSNLDFNVLSDMPKEEIEKITFIVKVIENYFSYQAPPEIALRAITKIILDFIKNTSGITMENSELEKLRVAKILQKKKINIESKN